MNYSYKRYWEPSTPQLLTISLSVNSLSTAITYPIEFVKTRVQIRSEGIGNRNKNLYTGINPNKVFRQIHETGNGMRSFYHGFESHLVSRLSYIFIRNYLYKSIYDQYKPKKPHNDLSHREKGVISGIAGGFAALLTTPAELINTRMIADGGRLKEMRFNYTGLLNGLKQVLQQEGLSGIFKGGFANILRAIVLNISLTGPYDYLQEKMWITFGDMAWLKWVALMWASFWATAFTLPFDNIKTRLQNQHINPEFNRLNYNGWVNAVQQVIIVEGIQGFHMGFFPFYARTFIYGWTTVFLTDKITRQLKQQAGLKEWQI